MIRASLSLLLFFLSVGAFAGEDAFRVGIFVDVSGVTVGPGAYKVTAVPGGSLGTKVWNTQTAVRTEAKGLRIGAEKFARKVRLEPVKKGAFVVVDGRPYRGFVEVAAKGPGRVTVVNQLDVEDYLRGVVASEMPSSWPLEALKVQSVVARSYALANRGRFGKDGYDLCATAACQVYGGIRNEKPATDQAVELTRGQAVLYKGKPVSAVFHSCCGGQTDDAADVWRSDGLPYLRGVKGKWCRKESPHYQWKTEISAEDLSKALRAAGRDLGTVKQVRIVSRTSAGRAHEVRVTGSEASASFKANDFRLIVGSRALRSTFWSGVSRSGKEWKFHGRGWGHGVGLCQWCAKSAADQGYKYKEILAYFYRHTKVKAL